MNYTFYKKNGSEFTLIQNKIVYYIGVLFFIGLEIWTLFFDEEVKNSTLFKIIPAVLILLLLSQIGKRVIINMQNKTVETSIFGLMKDVHSLNDFQRFVITKHRTNFIKTGISLSFEFLTNGKLGLATLNNFYRLSKVEALLEETKIIVNQK